MALGYTRLGIRAYFKANVQNAAFGHYGLRLRINDAQYVEFDSSEMFGSVYNTAEYFPQSKIFDIANVTLNKISIELYQSQDFANSAGELLSAATQANIFVRDLTIDLGYDEKSTPRADQVKLYTENSLNYNLIFNADRAPVANESKTVSVLWKHYDETTDKFVENPEAQVHWFYWCPNEVSTEAGLGWKQLDSLNSATAQFNNFYTATVKSEFKYGLTHLEGFTISDADAEFYYNNPNSQEGQAIVTGIDKNIIIYTIGNTDITLNKYESDFVNLKQNTNAWALPEGNTSFTIVYRPNSKNSTDKIKAVVYIDDTHFYSSDIMTFTNGGLVVNSDIDPESIRTIVNEELAGMDLPSSEEIAQLEAAVGNLQNEISIYSNGLEVIYKTDDLNGSYYVYGLNNKIKDSKYSSAVRSLGAVVFNSSTMATTEITDTSEDSNFFWKILQGSNLITVSNNQQQHDGNLSEYYKGITFNYKIKSYFKPAETKTIIQCIYRNIIDNTRVPNKVAYYIDTIELNFGYQGSNGSDYTAVLTMENFEALIKNTSNNQVKLRLYNSLGEEVNTESLTVLWSWLLTGNEDTINGVTLSGSNSLCTLTVSNDFDVSKNVCILQATIQELTGYDLIAYLPIPGASQNGIEATGPRTIWYTSEGIANIDNKIPYSIPSLGSSENPEGWDILYYLYDSDNGLVNLPEAPMGAPSINRKKYLIPSSVIINTDAFMSVITYKSTSNVYMWSCPILIYQNRYGSDTLNQWDGSTQVNLNDNGKILTSYIAAGEKEASDNTFSGVVMGNVKIDDTDISQLGLYGMSHGSVTYAFRKDGSAFIGASNSGRIEFDGEKAIIKSADENGLIIDLNGNEDNNYTPSLTAKNGVNLGDTILVNDGVVTLISDSIQVKSTPDDESPKSFSELLMDDSAIKAIIHETISYGETDTGDGDNGIPRFVTTNGTFDKDGLTISQTIQDGTNSVSQPTQSRLNWQGLEVRTNDGETEYTDNEILLQVNYQGANAKNLSTKKYLIIGDTEDSYSRFEPYERNDEKRTACFFITR